MQIASTKSNTVALKLMFIQANVNDATWKNTLICFAHSEFLCLRNLETFAFIIISLLEVYSGNVVQTLTDTV